MSLITYAIKEVLLRMKHIIILVWYKVNKIYIKKKEKNEVFFARDCNKMKCGNFNCVISHDKRKLI